MKAISFDVDGTIVDGKFMDRFWNELIPKYYSEKHGIDYSKALEFVKKCYDEVGDKDLRWYLPDYWFERFQLDIELKDVLEEFRGELRIYPDALEVLEKLRDKYRLIAISNAVREIMEFELEDMSEFFWKTFSCPSDLGDIRRKPEIYIDVCRSINLSPTQLLHVGDHPYFDFEVPTKAGIRSILIDREGVNGHIKSLRELEDFIPL
ncbi:HAD family hydrolase [Archaeoglobales archaeon]|nr:MAG: HAD family hydrolase [Archaeoglobales archaeon]